MSARPHMDPFRMGWWDARAGAVHVSLGDLATDDAYEQGWEAYLSNPAATAPPVPDGLEPADGMLEAFEMLGQLASMPSDRLEPRHAEDED